MTHHGQAEEQFLILLKQDNYYTFAKRDVVRTFPSLRDANNFFIDMIQMQKSINRKIILKYFQPRITAVTIDEITNTLFDENQKRRIIEFDGKFNYAKGFICTGNAVSQVYAKGEEINEYNAR